ncbi:hypothetical protein OG462_43075 [Streptomyces sp. NBC_01077]|uniref:hypothetical protein n=1 Tax=Streptomyces sp. NBC_01077 TaxID=2903746 RepID=UPI00386CF6C1|nr:hypothetical protein OG462_01930 [Streptomyces sp. NBC_01077]WSV43584.1 hypothetical protein OG462_43075 [Streptomyces sp. NBC_01077]
MALWDVPLLALPGSRLEFDYGEPLDCAALSPLDAVGALASTQTGFMPPRCPDYQFPEPLSALASLCQSASTLYSQEDAQEFRKWVEAENDALAHRAGTLVSLIQSAISLPLPEQELLMVPLIYLNHMWRQGSPVLEAASGPSVMPPCFDVLLTALSESSGILPRFNQLIMTMRAWQVDGLSDGDRVSYRELADLNRIRPYFWLNGVNQSELNFYRAFFAVESFGIPIYGWGALALECAAADDAELGAFALRCVHDTLRNVYFCVRHLVPKVDPVEFRKIQLTGGWVNDDLNGAASGYQLPFMLMLDSLFQVDYSHPGAASARANGLRFVPGRWKEFFRSIHDHTPGLRSWVQQRQHTELTEAYQSCVDMYTVHRTLHRYTAGQTLRGATTTGRAFVSSERNYRDFMSETGALVRDTEAVGLSEQEERRH